jgi:hypothetical protein
MGWRVEVPNAFTINWLGPPGVARPFPFSLERYAPTDGVFSIFLHPQRLIDIADILGRPGRLAIFGVEHSATGSGADEPPTLPQIAKERGVVCRAVAGDVLLIAASDLAELLASLPHHSFRAFHVPAAVSDDAIIAGVRAYDAHASSAEHRLLPELLGATLFINSHDDCYLYIEARDAAPLKETLARALQIYAGTMLLEGEGAPQFPVAGFADFDAVVAWAQACQPAAESKRSIEVADVGDAVVDALWPSEGGVSFPRRATERTPAGLLRIGVSPVAYGLREPRDYPITRTLTYDPASGVWAIQ